MPRSQTTGSTAGQTATEPAVTEPAVAEQTVVEQTAAKITPVARLAIAVPRAIAATLLATLTIPLGAAEVVLTEEQVDAVASQTTVVIGQGLQKGDIEAQREWNPGSGTIVARRGDRYYVLTALHVVRTRDTVYGVRTSDGEVHLVDDVNTDRNIYPLGREADEFGETISGLDLAVVEFESNNNYPIAVMGDSGTMRPGEPIFVSGWPTPENFDVRRVRVTEEGELTAMFPPADDGGYSLLYSNETRRGMSGGPVFNASGELIGVHGRGRAIDQAYCLDPELSERNSCGIQTVHFISRAISQGLILKFAEPPVDPETIATGLAAREDADTIDNIYTLFTFDLRSLLRDGPSGGCGSLLLGDDCDGL